MTIKSWHFIFVFWLEAESLDQLTRHRTWRYFRILCLIYLIGCKQSHLNLHSHSMQALFASYHAPLKIIGVPSLWSFSSGLCVILNAKILILSCNRRQHYAGGKGFRVNRFGLNYFCQLLAVWSRIIYLTSLILCFPHPGKVGDHGKTYFARLLCRLKIIKSPTQCLAQFRL